MVLKHNSKGNASNLKLNGLKGGRKATLLRLGKVRVVDSYPTKLSTFGLNKKPWREYFKIDKIMLWGQIR